MRDVLLEARGAIDEGFDKASAIIGEDLGLPEDQAKRARKLDESEALAKCKRAETKPNKASKSSKPRKPWGHPHQFGGPSGQLQPHMVPAAQ
eukprot:7495822-Pyramimonas_sp.AAC.1